MAVLISSVRGKPWVMVAIVILPLIVAIAIAAALLLNDESSSSSVVGGSEPSGTSTGGQGGGGQPSIALLSVNNSLPLPPGSSINQAPVAAGGDRLLAVYWSSELPGKLAEFYKAKLPSAGWVESAGPSISVSDPKDDGTVLSSYTLTFTKDGFQVVISIAANTKDASKGASGFAITITPK